MNEGRFTVGQEIELDIEGYTSEGDGVGRSAGAVFFVPGAICGERVRARVTAVRKNFYLAEAAAVLERAPVRQAPPCPHFGECGGCRLQHMAYPEQLALKENRVRGALERIGGIAGDTVKPIRGMVDPWRYRNKVTLSVAEKDGRPILGFLRKGSHEVIEVRDCLLADAADGGLAQTAFRRAWEAGGRRLARVTIRRSRSSGKRLVVLETAQRPLERGREIAEGIMSRDASVAGVVNAITAGTGGGGSRDRLLAGEDRITETLAGVVFSISAVTFFQVNSLQAEALYARAAGLLPGEPGTRVLDAYCGAGGFALFLARRAESVLGVESDAAAVRDAALNARRNGLLNVRFAAADLGKPFDRLFAGYPGFTDIVVDPPRRGLSARILDVCARPPVRRVIYASCDPATLARDCRALKGKGFTVKEITPFDMFPQTAHVESLALLERT